MRIERLSVSMRIGLLRRGLQFGLAVPAIALLSLAAAGRQESAAKVDFSREIEPLFKAHCYKCHGPDQQLAGLRIDSRAMLLKGGASGAAIVPGSGAKSLLVERL